MVHLPVTPQATCPGGPHLMVVRPSPPLPKVFVARFPSGHSLLWVCEHVGCKFEGLERLTPDLVQNPQSNMPEVLTN